MNKTERYHLQQHVLQIARTTNWEFTSDDMRQHLISSGLCQETVSREDFGGSVITRMVADGRLMLKGSVQSQGLCRPFFAIRGNTNEH